MTGFPYIALFIYIVYSVHNSIIIIVINIITVICVVNLCYWLFRNCAQKLGTWAGEWEKVADACKIKIIFCWQICSPWIWFLGVWRIFTHSSRIIWPQEFYVVKLASHWSAGNIYALLSQNLAPYVWRNRYRTSCTCECADLVPWKKKVWNYITYNNMTIQHSFNF